MAQSDHLGIPNTVVRIFSPGERVPVVLYALNVVVGLNFLASILASGYAQWLSFSLYFAFSIVVDECLGHWRATDPVAPRTGSGVGYQIVVFLIALVVVATFVAFFVVMPSTPLFSLSWVLRVCTLGLALGILGIPVAHELGHRRSRFYRTASSLMMALIWQPQFEVAHNMSHHRWVGTANDPATARYGENAYSFIIRSYIGGWSDALHLERRRLRHLPLLKKFFRHRVLRRSFYYSLFSVSLLLLVPPTVVFGWLLSCAFAAALLELFNYISHYGMQRRFSDGEYERVGFHHVWSSDYPTIRFSMLELPFHADHHVHARKHFYDLCNRTTSPQLPVSYQALYVLALAPPFWFAVMNPLVRRHWAAMGVREEDHQLVCEPVEKRLFGYADIEEP
jgi:alkane 1-monooxygenase